MSYEADIEYNAYVDDFNEGEGDDTKYTDIRILKLFKTKNLAISQRQKWDKEYGS